ncbi:MAG: hypothetical protein V3U37_00590 [Nitrospinaceae bacterium]
MIREDINHLIEEITRTHRQEDIFEAKKDFQEISGKIFDDDKSYESRVGCFLEWYTFDRAAPDSGLTPLQHYLQNPGRLLDTEKKELAEAVSQSIHGLFIAKKIKSDCVLVVDIMEGLKYQVHETQGSILFNSDDIFEGRLIPYKDQFYFTDHFCYHPKATAEFIRAKVRSLKTQEEEALSREKRLLKDLAVPQKKLNKITARIEKLNGKLEGVTKEKKIESLKEKIAKLEDQKEQLETQISDLEQQLHELRTVTIEGEHRHNRFAFIRKLSYMSLKLERSRQIDVRDIYQD